MLPQLKNYAEGRWHTASTPGEELYNAVTGDPIYTASSAGLDFGAMMQYARRTGGPALRRLTFHERGRMLKALAFHLTERKEAFYDISYLSGATRADSWIDIEGGIGNLFSYASLRRQFPAERFYVDGEQAKLSKQGTFVGQHIMVPREGVAIHINAFNFPVWGMLEKIAVNLLAGVPAIVKPATLTSYLTEAVFEEIIRSGILPEGSLQLICGSARGILDTVQNGDVVTFTGSSHTGRSLAAHPRLLQEAVPFNLEADSLNCCVLGPDVTPDAPEWDLFIKEVAREMTAKTGQKCTAIRRIIVPENKVEDVRISLGKRLAGTTIGDPRAEGVRMGPVASQGQRKEVQERIGSLQKSGAEIAIGDLLNFDVVGADKEKGAFLPPIVLLAEAPLQNHAPHDIEAFGPVSTIFPYKGADVEEAVTLARMGKGSLVCSIVTHSEEAAKDFVLGAAAMHGRILVLNRDCAKENTGHGSPLPMLIHGGPGRAGGGEELGGKRGVLHYLQRTAVQGSPTMLTRITNVYQPGGAQTVEDIHPFRKHYEDLRVGDTEVTAKHTVTDADITAFANLSGDHFYAHMDATSLEGTIFERRVAHGYYILSKAAGLFVDARKGPVLLNYGIDEARFTKPVYPGATIGVRLTVKEKVDTEKRTDDDVAKGIVRWLVDVYDETGETVAIATILTMVKKRDQA